MTDWNAAEMAMPPLGVMGWLRVLRRGILLGGLTYFCLLLMLVLRAVEAPLYGVQRPWSPFITQFVCRSAMAILGIRYTVRGKALRDPGAIVANHSSWLDIFTLNAAARVYFVSKEEVHGWPGIGVLARATGTVFITRKGTEAKKQQELFEARLKAGHKLLFFPEGTSTDALHVLPFKSTLFQAFFTVQTSPPMQVQPVTVVYHAPEGEDARHYGWWGDMEFGPHLLMVLADRRGGAVEVIFHAPVTVAAFENRKVLANYCERVIRTSHPLAD
jgi:1-acyl-sn-glycerol-3-phosphate acyltransferase